MLLKNPKTNIFLETDRPADITRMMGLGWVEVTPEQAEKAVDDAIGSFSQAREAAGAEKARLAELAEKEAAAAEAEKAKKAEQKPTKKAAQPKEGE